MFWSILNWNVHSCRCPSPLIFIVSSTWEKQMPSQVGPQISEDSYHGSHPTLLSCLDIKVIFYCSLDYILQHTAAVSFPRNVLSFWACSVNSYVVFRSPFLCAFPTVTFPNPQTEHFFLRAPTALLFALWELTVQSLFPPLNCESLMESYLPLCP